jgi:hypothetical protein
VSAPQNREEWLIRAAEALGPLLTEQGHELVPMRVSVGWPGGRGPKKNVRGQCWPTGRAEDRVAQIFISPVQADTITTLAVLLHEMVHAIDDCKSSHNGGFIKIARSVGFVSKWTSSDNRTDELTAKLTELAEGLGSFPHAALGGAGDEDAPKPQETRQLKVVCADNPEYKVRMTRKWLEEVGPPICPCHHVEMEEAE